MNGSGLFIEQLLLPKRFENANKKGSCCITTEVHGNLAKHKNWRPFLVGNFRRYIW